MAQIVTITNPLTGQPAQVDQLEHTAQQIDDAIARALPGGAIDIALANNNPRRWGLGAYAKNTSDLDSITDTGWYAGRPLVDGDNTLGGSIIQHFQYENSKNATQIAYTNNANSWDGNIILIREKKNNVWSPWEWLNPPMRLGTEYRTTERYNGKPVYAKRILCESMPAGAGYIDILPSNTEVPNALISTAIVIRCYGRASVATTIPFYSYAGDFMQVGSVSNNTIRLYTAQAYGGTAEITVYYVKTTD